MAFSTSSIHCENPRLALLEHRDHHSSPEALGDLGSSSVRQVNQVQGSSLRLLLPVEPPIAPLVSITGAPPGLPPAWPVGGCPPRLQSRSLPGGLRWPARQMHLSKAMVTARLGHTLVDGTVLAYHQRKIAKLCAAQKAIVDGFRFAVQVSQGVQRTGSLARVHDTATVPHVYR